jgi:hypothetical protein
MKSNNITVVGKNHKPVGTCPSIVLENPRFAGILIFWSAVRAVYGLNDFISIHQKPVESLKHWNKGGATLWLPLL